MEHLPQHHPRGSSAATSFSSALSLLPPAVCPRSQGHKLWLPALPGHDVLGHSPQLWVHPAPSLLWGWAAQSQGNENLLGHNANSTLTSHKSSAPWPYLPLPRPLAPPPPPPPKIMALVDVQRSCAGTLGCAWEPFSGSICRKV